MGRSVSCKICQILSHVILEQFLFENEKRPFQNYRLMKKWSTNTNGEAKVSVDIKDEVLCHDS